MQKLFVKSIVISTLILSSFAAISLGQGGGANVILPNWNKETPVALRNNVYCAGYISTSPVDTSVRIVGANNEWEKTVYVRGDYLYINKGASSGVKVGDMFSVTRPKGKFSSKFSTKGNLGIFVQELGTVEVVKVKNDISVARVKVSCDNFLLGDLLQPMENRQAPMFKNRPALDVFGEPSGKVAGNIVMSREMREAIAKEHIVYIDLGADDSVQAGDYLTIFRQLGKGGIINKRPDEGVEAKNSDYGSRVYQGGPFSNQAGRKEGSEADGHVVTMGDAKKGRPADIRKVLGEMVILNVKEKTATALIVRSVEEIHPGDKVEKQ